MWMKITYKKLTERDNFVFSWKAAHRKNGREGVQRRERERESVREEMGRRRGERSDQRKLHGNIIQAKLRFGRIPQTVSSSQEGGGADRSRSQC